MSRRFATRAIARSLIVALTCTPILGSFNAGIALAQTPQNTTTSYGYDQVGNVTSITDPLGHLTSPSYDELSRVNQLLQPSPGTGQARTTTVYSYDGRDQLATVKDPRNLLTTYTVDGLGNGAALASPDTGGSMSTFDAAGNQLTSTDARGKTTTYTFDALNRVTSLNYASGTPTTLEYDGGSAGGPTDIGHLTTMTDESGHTRYAYDALGRMLSKTQTVLANASSVDLTVAYTYGTAGSANGKLLSVTYPSGSRIDYGYDSAGRVASLTANLASSAGASTVPLLTEIGYAPFGGVQSWKWGNDSAMHPNTVTRSYDLDGRLTGYPLGNPAQNGLQRTVTYDAASRITAITHTGNGTGTFAPGNFTQTYGYDDLNRLISVGGTATPPLAFTYDATGNRTQVKTGAAIVNYAINASSNRIAGTSGTAPPTTNLFDATGNTTSDGTVAYTYSARGRLQSVTKAGATIAYLYNGAGQRVIKSGAPVATGANLYAYDEQGHLLGEYDTAGHALQETVFLGDIPVAVLSAQLPTIGTPAPPSGAINIYYVYADHIATPRVLVGASNDVIVWRWDATDPFGAQAPNEDPSVAGSFTYNPRFPGQFFDKESSKHYNYFRDYDPQTGRYVQSDPIGLAGGINTYAYVGGNPLSYTDLFGRARNSVEAALQQAILEGNVGEVEVILDATGLADSTAVARASANANKITHIFGEAAHKLDPLINACGSKGKALEAMRAASEKAAKGLADGLVRRMPVVVNGISVQVNGVVTNGVFLLGTGFIP